MVALIAVAAIAQKPIYDLEIAPDDRWLAVSNATDRIWIYSLPEAKLVKTLAYKKGSHLLDIEITPDGRLMGCSNVDFTGTSAPIWRTSDWVQVSRLGVPINKNFVDPPNSLEIAGGGQYFLGTTVMNRLLVCWEADGDVAYVARKNPNNRWFGIAVNPNTTLVALFEPGIGDLRFWDFAQNRSSRVWGSKVTGVSTKTLRQIKFNHAGTMLFAAAQPRPNVCDLMICKPRNGRTSVTVTDRIDHFSVRDCAWSYDDSVVWVGGLNGQMACFDPQTGRLRTHWTAHKGKAVKSVAAMNTSYTVLTAGGQEISFWEGMTGKLLRTIQLPVE